MKESNNKFINEILNYYNKIEHFNPDIMYNYANPIIITKLLKKYSNYIDEEGIRIFDNSIYVYPRDYFYPLSYNYSEREYTQNTCMVHLFNATWTSKGERRTINVYRKFGPDFGRFINKRLDNILGVKSRIIEKLSRKKHNLKMFYSIHINRNKRINKIAKELSQKKNESIIICNPEYVMENKTVENMQKDNIIYIREQYTSKEAKLIAKSIAESNKKTIIFNSYSDGWDKIVQELKRNNRNIIIKFLIHGNISLLADDIRFEKINEILNLYDKGKINEIGIFNEETYIFYKSKGYNVSLLNECIDIKNAGDYIANKEKKEYKMIGMYPQNCNVSQNIYNQLASISLLEDAKLDLGLCSYQISTIARKYNLNLSVKNNNQNNDSLYKRMVNNDAILCINLVDDASTIPLESFELETPCLVGKNCNYFSNSSLEKYIVVDNECDIYEIKNKLEYVIENKDIIVEEYKNWKKDYLINSLKLFNEFIKE